MKVYCLLLLFLHLVFVLGAQNPENSQLSDRANTTMATNATLVGAFVFPHGAITLDPDTRDLTKVPAYLPTTKTNCEKLHHAMKAQAEALVALKPDLILFTTPHGLRLRDAFVFHGNEWSFGSAEWDGEWKQFTANIKVDVNTTSTLVNALTVRANAVDMLAVGSADMDKLPLRWGEAVPWWFIQEAYNAVNKTASPAVIVGIPVRVRSESGIQELIKIGSDIWTFIKTNLSDKRVVIVTSGDLAHAHSTNATSPYPFHSDAQPFDDKIVAWSKLDIDEAQSHPDSSSNQLLLKDTLPLFGNALTCGYTGLVFLQGALTACARDPDPMFQRNFKANFLSYSWPTYYGMIVNSFVVE